MQIQLFLCLNTIVFSEPEGCKKIKFFLFILIYNVGN